MLFELTIYISYKIQVCYFISLFLFSSRIPHKYNRPPHSPMYKSFKVKLLNGSTILVWNSNKSHRGIVSDPRLTPLYNNIILNKSPPRPAPLSI